ncbi:MAG: copper resistance protein CopC [Dietzia sp.]|nr:copper resistance protein CopC [Dietzia sp.]
MLLLALLVTAAVLIPATSAAAHESLVSASPAEGETVTSEISEVTLTFSSEPLSGAEDASFVEVKTTNGRIVTRACLVSL